MADWYSKIEKRIFMSDHFYSVVVNLLKDVTKNKKRILDVGCGNGYLLQKLREFDRNLELYGVDFSPKLVENARKRLLNGAIIKQNSAYNIPYSDKFFDIVVMTEVIEHLREPSRGLKEAYRVLKDDGYFIVTFPNATAYSPIYKFFERMPKFLKDTQILRSIFLPAEHPLNTFQPIDTMFFFSDILNLLRDNKFKIRKISGSCYLPYLTLEIRYLTKIDSFFNKLGLTKMGYRLAIMCEKR